MDDRLAPAAQVVGAILDEEPTVLVMARVLGAQRDEPPAGGHHEDLLGRLPRTVGVRLRGLDGGVAALRVAATGGLGRSVIAASLARSS